jgi:hypothetical protein
VIKVCATALAFIGIPQLTHEAASRLVLYPSDSVVIVSLGGSALLLIPGLIILKKIYLILDTELMRFRTSSIVRILKNKVVPVLN